MVGVGVGPHLIIFPHYLYLN